MTQKQLKARCGGCDNIWVVADLPQPVAQVAQLMMKAECSNCGEKNKIYVAGDKVQS